MIRAHNLILLVSVKKRGLKRLINMDCICASVPVESSATSNTFLKGLRKLATDHIKPGIK
jgi:hypothetical protein